MWLEIKHKGNNLKPNTIVAISDDGYMMLHNGEIKVIPYRQHIRTTNGKIRAYKLIADNFLITVHRPDQTMIDHMTHKPSNMNINDVRNLRYCTNAENLGFPESRENLSKAKKGKSTWNKGVYGDEYINHFKNGIHNQFTKVG